MTANAGNPKRLPILTWENALAFSGPLGPKPIVRAVLFTMARRADNTSLEFYMGVDELSHIMGTAYSTAEKHLQRALDSGWLEQTSRGGSFGRVSNFRLTVGATENPEGGIPAPPNRRSVSADSDGNSGEDVGSDSVSDGASVRSPSKMMGSTHQKRGVEPIKNDGPTTPELLPTSSLSLSDRTLTRCDDHEKEETDEPEPLSETWVPNNTNRVRATRMGYDPAELVGNFHRRLSARSSRNWNKTFGFFLSCVEDGWHEVEDKFPVDRVLGHTGIVEKVTTTDDTMPVPATVQESTEPAPDVDLLPISWERPEWLTEADERLTTVLAGRPDEDTLCRALGEYLISCEKMKREPASNEFPPFVRKFVSSLQSA